MTANLTAARLTVTDQEHEAARIAQLPDEDLYPTLQRHEAMAALLATEIRNRKARQEAE